MTTQFNVSQALVRWQQKAQRGDSAHGSGCDVVTWYETHQPNAETLLYMLAYALDELNEH
jgi:hypothetical protein